MDPRDTSAFKNIRDGGSTVLYAAYTVDMVYTVNLVFSIDIVYTVDMVNIVDTVDTVYTVQTAFHCLNTSWAGRTDVQLKLLILVKWLTPWRQKSADFQRRQKWP